MSASKRIAFAMTVSWISRALSILATLYLIPAMFRYMAKEELGIWYLIGNSQAFLGLLGFGVAPVLTRHIAFLARSTHLDPGAPMPAPERESLANLLFTGQKLLRWMAVLTFVVAWIAGYFLIRTVPLERLAWSTVLWAWTLMCAGWGLTVWMSYLDCWAAGLGYVGWDTLVTMSVTAATMLANIVAVTLGGGLICLAWIALVSVLIQRALLILFLRRRKAVVFSLNGRWERAVAQTIWRPALHLWVMTAGGFLLYKTDQYFIALFRGVSEVAVYQSTYNTVSTVSSLAQAYLVSSAVFVSQFWSAGDLDSIHRLLMRGCRIGLVITVTGAVFLLLAGKEFFQLWLNGAFLGYPILIVLVTTILLDTHHILLTLVSRATDDEKYALPAMVAGVLNLILTWVLIQKIGLIGVPIGTLLAQVVTNNWYGVYRPLSRLRFPFALYAQSVLAPVAGYGVATALFTFLAMQVAARPFGNTRLALCGVALFSCAIAGSVGLLWAFRSSANFKTNGRALPLPHLQNS